MPNFLAFDRFTLQILSVRSSVWMNFNRVALQHNSKFIIFLFCYLMVSVITMCNLIKCLIRATFLSTPARDGHEQWKQTARMNNENKRHGQAIKIARETTNNQKKRYKSVKHLQIQQFSFTNTSIKVSLKILGL